MEQQYGQRAILDDRFHKQQQQQRSSGGSGAHNGGLSPHSAIGNGGQHTHGSDRGTGNAYTENPRHFTHDRRSSSSSVPSAQPAPAELEALQETIAHQKYEIVRLLNTVKSLSSENTKLLKVRVRRQIGDASSVLVMAATRAVPCSQLISCCLHPIGDAVGADRSTQKCDTLTSVQSENREIQESMEKFKAHYNQKVTRKPAPLVRLFILVPC